MQDSTRGAVRVALAVAVFAAVHSALAANRTKRLFARVAGERRRNALYRPMYNALAVGCTAWLIAEVWKQRTKTIYEARGTAKTLMLAGQAVAAVELTRGVAAIGFARFLGFPGLLAWMRGESYVPVEPEGQGPAGDLATMHVAGPFRYSRHPLNAWTIVLLWLIPRMSVASLSFNLASTFYLVLGSRHEESRLLRRYEDAYSEYLRSGVRFLA